MLDKEIAIISLSQLKDNYSYLVLKNKKVIIVDPAESTQIIQYIKNNQQPKLLSNENTHWKCQKLCLFSNPYKEGAKKSTCQHIRDEIRIKGVNKVIEEYGKPDRLSTYGDGGGRLAKWATGPLYICTPITAS